MDFSERLRLKGFEGNGEIEKERDLIRQAMLEEIADNGAVTGEKIEVALLTLLGLPLDRWQRDKVHRKYLAGQKARRIKKGRLSELIRGILISDMPKTIEEIHVVASDFQIYKFRGLMSVYFFDMDGALEYVARRLRIEGKHKSDKRVLNVYFDE